MAKEQDLPLNPQKISGVCGRLYCCLTFEYDDYKALRGTLPKVGSMLSTPAGEAKVTGIDFNREMVKLWLTEQSMAVEVHAIDFQLQHGVTVRPMELVRRIEGELRPLFEDSSQTVIPQSPGGRLPRQRPERAPRTGGQQQGRGGDRNASRGGVSTETDQPGGESQQRSGERRGGRGRGRGGSTEGVRPEGSRPGQQAGRQAPAPPQPAPSPASAELAGDQQRKRRRRRRGRGGGGAGGGQEGGGPTE
jgi:hypothetical protein